MRIISDIHGNTQKYSEIIRGCDTSIQLGDFGFKSAHEFHNSNIDWDKHKVLFGNHDYYPAFYNPHSLGDSGSWNGIFTVRGADSIDKHHRKFGIDWFQEEELSIQEGNLTFDLYESTKPEIVVTHDCPQSVMERLFGYPEKSRTRQLLDALLDVHQPKLWIFGHHHKSRSLYFRGTTFICLPEFGFMDINL